MSSSPALSEQQAPLLEHVISGGADLCCAGPSKDFVLPTEVALSEEVSTPYTEAIDWNTQVDTGVFNEDGDMVITYAFASGTGNFGGIFPRLEWTEYEQQQVEVAFDTFEVFIDVEFVETTNTADADFVLNKVNSFGLFLGVMNPPGESGEGQAGFNGGVGSVGWDEGDGNGNPTNGGLEQGGFGFVTLIHEFGHGLGLAHPHDNGGGSEILPGVGNSDDTGDLDANQGVYTMMSYVDGWETHPDGPLDPFSTPDYGWTGTPMALDIAVLQDKYGANDDYNTGDDVYILPDANEAGTFWSCIWDAGGNDTILHDGTDAAVIDLRDATLLLEEGGGGWISWVDGIYGGYTIANGVMIENATGGSGDDYLIGNEGDNVLTGNAGADTFVFTTGAGGSDTLADFEAGIDMVDVTEIRPSYTRSDLTIEEDSSGTTIFYGEDSIFFAGVALDDLSRSDFILV